MVNELHDIMDQHPELICYPYSHTWKGMLIVQSPSNPDLKERFKIHLSVPNYPSIIDAELYIDAKLCNYSTDQIKEILHTSNSVSVLLLKLQHRLSLITTFEKNHFEDFSCSKAKDSVSMVQEIQQVLLNKDVNVLSSPLLGKLKLTRKNVSMILQRKQGSWEVVSSDLPHSLEFQVDKNYLLIEVAEKFLERAKLIDQVVEQLQEIDEHCFVIDPVNPQPNHLYRRIYLEESVSFLCTVDPMDTTQKPEISLLGKQSRTSYWLEKITEKVHDWDPTYSIYDNLKLLFSLECFPKPMEVEKEYEEIVSDEECVICYSLESESGHIPDKVCNNEKCKVKFHSSCLKEWLMSLPNNETMFGEIQGTCPNCNDKISCSM